eukprot:11518203-Alexandrium_andersonii.AAC.1
MAVVRGMLRLSHRPVPSRWQSQLNKNTQQAARCPGSAPPSKTRILRRRAWADTARHKAQA